jgi:hypothetical protein
MDGAIVGDVEVIENTAGAQKQDEIRKNRTHHW